MIQILQKLAVFCKKKTANFTAQLFGEIIFNIITSETIRFTDRTPSWFFRYSNFDNVLG
jgi:hypothetical protein